MAGNQISGGEPKFGACGLTQKLGDNRALLIQREYVVGKIIVVPESPEAMRKLEQSLAGDTGSRGWAAGPRKSSCAVLEADTWIENTQGLH